MSLRLLVSAVEPSADRLAAEVLAELRGLARVEALGVAGPALRALGVWALARAEELSVNGLWELLPRLGALRRARALLEEAAAEADLALLVDAPDFHYPLGRRLRARGLPVVGLVAPQVWAWRPGRARDAARSLDRLLCLFPFEPELFREHGLDARFAGHPVVDRLAGLQRVAREDCFALLPGSRPHELASLLPAFLAAAEELRALLPGARFRLGRAPGAELPPLPPWVQVVDGLPAAALPARSALVASGTATLELAVLGVPMVVAYRVHPLTYGVGRLLVRGVRHLALPNILLGRELVPEHLQRMEPVALARDLLAVGAEQERGLAELRERLGPPGAARRAARLLLDLAPGGRIRGGP